MQCQTPFFLCRLFVTFFGLWSSLTVQAQLSTNLPGWNNPRNYDQFTYQDSRSTRTVGDSGITSTSYPPDQWINVQCPNEESCLGWHEQYEESVGWELEVNSCVWCPKGQSSGKSQCRQHHQSPIDLLRSRAIEKNNPDYNECIDGHWMAYVDSSCSFEELERLNAFHIERHALQVIQPIEPMPDDAPDIQDQNGYRNACQYNPTTNTRNRFGKIDFPKGFSQWWHLSHIDLHVPSEHTQEGKRYDGELQMYHIYSVTAREAGVDNEMGVVSVFIQSYDDSADYPLLNRIICQWRKAEERTREQCGLPSVESQYPGCYPYHRTFGTNGTAPESTVHETMAANPEGSRRTLLRSRTQHDATQPYTQKPLSMHDIVLENDFKRQQHEQQLLHNASYSEPFRPKIVHLTSENEDEVKRMEEDIDWDAFVKDIYQREEEAQANNGTHRHLLDYQHVGPFHNYWPLIDSRTEYYFRYSGTQTVPPCYGRFTPGERNRRNTNHWRVMKDPIRVSKRQVNELHRLLKERIAPPNDPLKACQPDTAAKIDPENPDRVNVARPLQETHLAHFKVFCECPNWRSKWNEDRQWCNQFPDQLERYYDHPYNFETDGL